MDPRRNSLQPCRDALEFAAPEEVLSGLHVGEAQNQGRVELLGSGYGLEFGVEGLKALGVPQIISA